MLVGDRAIVIDLLIVLRVQLEALALDDRVLDALDRLAADWKDKTASARRRRHWRLHALANERPDSLERRSDA